VDVDDEGDAPFFLVSSIMSETTLTDFATSTVRRCPPQFQVISLITIFLSVLVSTIYVLYLILYAPLERIALIALAFIVWQNQRSPSIHQPPTAPLSPESFISLNDQYQPALPAYTPKSTISTTSEDSEDSESSEDSDVSLRPSAPRSNYTEPSPESPPSIGPTNVSAPSIPQSIFSALPIVEILDRPPSPQSTVYPVMSVKVSAAKVSAAALVSSSFMDSSVSTSVNETIQRRKLLEGFAESGNPVRRSRRVVYTSFDKLPASGYIKPVRLINESADGILEWKFPHQNGIDYRIQVTAAETIEFYEHAVKRPP